MIFAVAILNRSGKLLLAREFTHERRDQIEGQLGAFPKLVQFAGHSYIETDRMRFVFQEVGDLYIVILVSKDSNLVSDLEAISLLCDVTRKIVGDVNEEKVINKGIDLIFAFDECIFDGFRQNYNVSNIVQFLKMDSAEETEYNRIRAEKEAIAAANLRKHVSELEEKKMGGKASFIPSILQNSINNFQRQPNEYQFDNANYSSQIKTESSYRPSKPPTRGMSLSRSAGAKSKAQQVMAEEGIDLSNIKNESQTPPIQTTSNSNDFLITLHEKFTAIVSRLDAVREIGIEGRLMASIGRKFKANIFIDADKLPNTYKYKVMQQPKGTLWADTKSLIYDNTGPRYGPGNDVTLLCWRRTSTNNEDIPLNISCWVQQGRSSSTFSCDVELKKQGFILNQVEISIPVVDPRGVNVATCTGEVEIYENDQLLKWSLEPLTEQSSHGELEFSVPTCEDDVFFPVTISFNASSTICDIEILRIEPNNDEDSQAKIPKLEVTRLCTTNRYEIE